MCIFSNIYLCLSDKLLILWEIERKVLLGTPYWSMISSLLHLVGLRPRVYYTLTNFRGGEGPLGPPSIRQCNLYLLSRLLFKLGIFGKSGIVER